MLILIWIDVQYLQNVFSFEKGSNGSNNFPSDFHYPIKKIPHPLALFRKSYTL